MTEEILEEIKEEVSSSKKTKVAINGFGRIGRMIFRAGFEDPSVDFVAINASGGVEFAKYFLVHDSAQGKFPYDVEIDGDYLVIGEKRVKVISHRKIEELPWKDLGVDIVAECTGVFIDAEDTKKHIEQGAKKVVISAPGKGECFYLVRGVNDEDYNGEVIVSNGSCTTNSMTAVVNELNKKFGVNKGMFSTVHSVTGDQRILDASHKKDFRRGRAGPFNIVPTTTGAAKSVVKLIPELEGKLHGIAYRVPTITGSVTDLNLELKKGTSKEEVNKFLREVCHKHLDGIVEYSEDDLVSTDIIGNPHSGVIDAKSTEVIDKNFLKLVVWYDNEWGFSNRMVEVIKLINH